MGHTFEQHPSAVRVTAALVLVQLLFGINYVLSKQVVTVFPPLVWASSRLWVSSLVMLAVAAVLRWEHRPKWTREFFGRLMVFTLLGTVINQACFLVGLRYTTSTNSAVLNTLTPLFTLMLVIAQGREVATSRRILGFLSAFVGVLVLRKFEEFSLSDQTLVGDLLTLVNCMSMAVFLSLSQRFLQENDRLWATAWMFFFGAISMTGLALPDWVHFEPPVWTAELAWLSAYAIIGGTLATYFLQNWALAYAPPTRVALLIYLQPVIAGAFGWWWAGAEVSLRTGIATGLIFGGMLLARQEKRASS